MGDSTRMVQLHQILIFEARVIRKDISPIGKSFLKITDSLNTKILEMQPYLSYSKELLPYLSTRSEKMRMLEVSRPHPFQKKSEF